MKKTILIHNPRCSKSRGAKEILEARGIDFEIVDYLKDGLTKELLLSLPQLLGLSYFEMIRSKEQAFKELELGSKTLKEKEWIEVLIKNPILLERPIFIHNKKGIIARPEALVLDLL
jgi:arsenate reductase